MLRFDLVIIRWLKGELLSLKWSFLYLNCFIDMYEIMSEFKEYYEDEIDDGIKEVYIKVFEKFEKLMLYEEVLVSVL